MQAEWLTRSPIAHRGLWDTAECPENSLAAFRKAVARGIPFELDVQLTRDGQLAVVHDTDLERLTGKPCAVADLDLDDLKRLRIGDTGERIPLLGEVLEIVARVPFVIDVRQWRGPRTGALEGAVLAAVRGYDGPFALQSFDPLAVFRMRRLAGDHPVGQASGNLTSAGRLARILGRPMFTNAMIRPSFISYELSALPSPWIGFWRRLGIPVLAWTVRSPAMEEDAVRVADNFFFDEYLPCAYVGDLGLRRDPRRREALMFSRYRVPLPQPVTDSSSPAFASQAEAWVRRIRKNYDDRANRHRIWYRSSGITVIVAGASLPVLTTIDYTGKNLAISLAGVLVAALTALRAFYRWDHMWALLRVTEFSVSQAYWEWRDAVDGRLGTTDDKATEENREATRLLVKRVDDLRQTEASSSFKDLPFPDQQPRT